jgi:hypothetical protein
MPAPQPGRSTRARWIIRTQLAAVSPARRHTPGIYTRATGFLPFTSPARYAVAAAFREARRDGHRHWGPGHLLLGLTAQDEWTAARALQQLEISREQAHQQAGQITARDREQAGAQDPPQRRGDQHADRGVAGQVQPPTGAVLAAPKHEQAGHRRLRG